MLFPLTGLAADEDLIGSFKFFRNGVAATDLGHVEPLKIVTTQEVEGFRTLWNSRFQRGNSGHCLRYADDLDKLLSQIFDDVSSFSGPDDFSRRLRLQLQIPALYSMRALFKENKEGGFGTLDKRSMLSCEIRDRAFVADRFDGAMEALSEFQQRAIGRPGIQILDQQIDKLLVIARQQGQHRQRVEWELMAGTTIVSLFFWEAAPMAAGLMTRALAGRIPDFVAGSAFAFGTRSAAFTGEAFAYRAVDNNINPEPKQRPESRLISWDEQMSDLEGLLNSPLDEPELYILYLEQIEAQIALIYQLWLKKNATPIYNFVGNDFIVATALARESVFLSGLSLEALVQHFPSLIEKFYGYQVIFDGGIFTGPGTVDTLIALRALTRALYSGAVAPLAPATRPILRIHFGTVTKLGYTSDRIDLTLSTDLNSQEMADRIRAVIESEALNKRVTLLSRFQNAAENFSLNMGIKLRFDPQITLADRWTTLNHLICLAKSEPNLFRRESERFFVTNLFAPLHENHMVLEEDIYAKASIETIRTFLDFSRIGRDGSERNTEVARLVRERRDQIADVQTELRELTKLELRCSDKGNLRLVACLNAAHKVLSFLKAHPNFKLPAKILLVLGNDEISTPVQEFSDEFLNSNLALRQDFSFPELAELSMRKGWLR
jgi:hypothetical protein